MGSRGLTRPLNLNPPHFMQLTLFEIIGASLLALAGGVLRILWNRTDSILRLASTNETRIAVLAADKTNIFHRLERIEEKLDRLLEK